MRETRGPEETARLLGMRIVGDKLEVIPKGLVDRWRDRPITEITGDDIFALIEECRERGVPGMEVRNEGPSDNRALAMFARVSKLFGWLLSKRRIKANPCMGIARTKPPKARDRTLIDEEIVAFWKAAEQEQPEFSAALKLLLLTGQRLSEVTDMRRSELSDDLWTIPGARTKNHKEHVVPLSPLAREILASIPVAGDLVFSVTGGRTPIIINTKIRERLVAATRGDGWRIHDLRRTCATEMARLKVEPHVIEAVLNHMSGPAKAGVAGIYNKWAYLPEKTAALARWATHVEGLVSGKAAKVVPIRAEA